MAESTSVKVDRFMRRLEAVEKHSRDTAILPRLPYSTLDGGAVTVTDPVTHEVRAYFGEQWDGTFTAAPVGGPPPPPPTVPLVTPQQGGLTLYWDGTFVDDSVTRSDFRRVTFHAVLDVDDLNVLDPAQLVGEITIATGGEVFAALPANEYFIFATTWSDAGIFSAESEVAYGTPLSLVDAEEWQAHEDALDQLNNFTIPELQDTTGTLGSSLLDLTNRVTNVESGEGGLGEVSDLVALIQRSTSSRHGIY